MPPFGQTPRHGHDHRDRRALRRDHRCRHDPRGARTRRRRDHRGPARRRRRRTGERRGRGRGRPRRSRRADVQPGDAGVPRAVHEAGDRDAGHLAHVRGRRDVPPAAARARATACSLPSCARYQLNLGHLLQRGPGSDEQWLHRDEAVWSDVPRPGSRAAARDGDRVRRLHARQRRDAGRPRQPPLARSRARRRPSR